MPELVSSTTTQHTTAGRRRRIGALVALVICVGIGGVYALAQQAAEKVAVAVAKGAETPAVPQRHPVTIKPGTATPRVLTGEKDTQGKSVTVGCATCHATTTPVVATQSAAELDQFHQGVKYQHGNLTCLSCHNSTNYDTLRLADGRSVEFPDVMTLCSQCHGTQRRDYDHGSHGGMNGFWDLTKGPRLRNNCVNCHDAHSPRVPQVLPVLPPRDRLSVPTKGSKSHEH